MTLKILAAALFTAGLAWVAAPASAAGPAMPHAQKATMPSPVDQVHWRRWRHRHCFWHRHRGHGKPWRHTHRHCRWHRGGLGGIIIVL
jgi:hypothetical protein